ncbi:secretory lipase-domain-containing protein [Aspergillus alliaceus]|nr:secretory lipase-domain-containing protein [Aspergillus alliaceus]
MIFSATIYSIVLCLTIIGQSTARSVPPWSLAKRGEPLLPSQDPFYKPDNEDWRTSKPGAILKTRNVTIGSLTGLPTSLGSAHQLLYRTTNGRGQPSYAVTTVLIPLNAKLDRLLSYQIAYDSPNPDCVPSYDLQFGASTSGDDSVIELSLLAQTFLTAGIPVSMPDYEGIESAYTVGPQAAYGVLDSLRAVLSSTDVTGMNSAAKTTLFGYSGGAFASEWAGELQSSYAPDVKIAGAAIGGVPVNNTKSFFTIDGTKHSGLLVGGLNGVANAFPPVARYIKDHLRPEYEPLFNLAKATCIASIFDPAYGYVPQLANKTISAFFDNGWSLVDEFAPLLDSIFVMGQHGVPDFPIFMYQGTADETVGGFGDVGDLVEQFCQNGAIVEYAKVENADHIPALFRGFHRAKSFLMGVYDGAVPSKCTEIDIQTVS